MADTSILHPARASSAVAEPTSHDPDARGHFGVFGGRYVPEALMAVIEEVTSAYEKACTDQTFLDELDRLRTHYARKAVAVVRGGRLSPACRGRGSSSSARTSTTRVAQDQQRSGTGASGQTDGKDQSHRRDRSRPARRGHRHRLRALLGLECIVYMGVVDTARQALAWPGCGFSARGSRCGAVGLKTLKDAVNGRSGTGWPTRTTYYCASAPRHGHCPFAMMVRDFQRVIGMGPARRSLRPDGCCRAAATACIGATAPAAVGIFHALHRRPGRATDQLRGPAVTASRRARHAATYRRRHPRRRRGAPTGVMRDRRQPVH